MDFSLLKYLKQPSYYITALLFAATLLVSIAVGLSVIQNSVSAPPVQTISPVTFLLTFALATLVLLFLVRNIRHPFLYRMLLYIALVQGLAIFAFSLFTPPLSYIIVVIFITAFFWFQNVAIHDCILIFSLGGIAAFFGTQFSPLVLMIILIFLTLYDYWAVYKTKHMVRIFKGIAEQKVHFAFIIPARFSDIRTKLRHVSTDAPFFFLGTGDVALPSMLAVSSLVVSPLVSLCVGVGSLLGYTYLYLQFVYYGGRKPMAGLPPIGIGAIIGFLIGFFYL